MRWNFKTVKKPDWFIESEEKEKHNCISFAEMTFWIWFSHFLEGILK